LKILTDTALPEYLEETVKSLDQNNDELIVDLEEVFHELTTQLMGRMAYDVSPSFCRHHLLGIFGVNQLTLPVPDGYSQL